MYEIKARDVLAYLNELGYKNIEAHQLKAFMTDLKKLIKQDNYYSLQELHDTKASLSNYNAIDPKIPTTDTSEVKSNTGPAITVQISKPKHVPACIGYNRASDYNITDITRNDDSKIPSPLRTIPSKAMNISTLSVPTSSTISCFNNQLFQKRRRLVPKDSSESTVARPTTSFIRVKAPILKPCRSDPVALYHYYEDQWKHTKIPGQDSHLDLRWTIREKMLGDHN